METLKLLTQDIIYDKAQGKQLSFDQLKQFIDGVVGGAVSEAQIGAWLMAVYLKGLSHQETSQLTQLMVSSGLCLEKKNPSEFWLDKHSTGGVGDKTSLLLVPWVLATCSNLWGEGSIKIPMISGRALGYTGGTLDKLESAHGFRTNLQIQEAYERLEQSHCFITGQTEQMVPADRILYAHRDKTSTVACEGLIVSSILSKKIAAGLDGLVLDVKVGAGGFNPNREVAMSLARRLKQVAVDHHLELSFVLTSMDDPLGYTIGNSLEMQECVEFLKGDLPRAPDLLEVTRTLGVEMLRLYPKNKMAFQELEVAMEETLNNGQALDLFKKMIADQGGSLRDIGKIPSHYKLHRLLSPRSGWIQSIDPKVLAHLLMEWGASTGNKKQGVDHQVGIKLMKQKGDPIQKGEPLVECIVSEKENSNLESDVLKAYVFCDKKQEKMSKVEGVWR